MKKIEELGITYAMMALSKASWGERPNNRGAALNARLKRLEDK